MDEDYEKSLQHMRRAKDILYRSENVDAQNLAFVWNEISVLEREREQGEEALKASLYAVEYGKLAEIDQNILSIYSINLGQAAFDTLKLDLSVSAFSEAYKYAKEAKNQELTIRSLIGTSSAQLLSGHPLATIDTITQWGGLDSEPKSRDEFLLCRILVQAYLLVGNSNSALFWLEKTTNAISPSMDTALGNEERTLSLSGMNTALLRARIAIGLADLSEAERLLEMIIAELPPDNNDYKPVLASAYYNIAEIHFLRGEFEESARHNRTSELLLLEIYGSDHPSTNQAIFRRGLIFFELGDYDLAEKLMIAAQRSLSQSLGSNSSYLLRFQTEILQLYSKKKDVEKSHKIARELEKSISELGGSDLKASLLGKASVGLFFKSVGELDKARRLLEEVQEGFQALNGFSHNRIYSLIALTEIYSIERQFDRGRKTGMLAVDFAGISGSQSIDRIGEARRVLAEIEWQLGNKTEALRLSRLNVELIERQLQEDALKPTYLSGYQTKALRDQVAQTLEFLWGHPELPSEFAKDEMFEVAQLVHLHDVSRASNGFLKSIVSTENKARGLLYERQRLSVLVSSLSRRTYESEITANREILDRISEAEAEISLIDTALTSVAPDILGEYATKIMTVDQVFSSLSESEVLWMQATFETQSFVFFLSAGNLEVRRAQIGELALKKLVENLRESVIPTVSGMPDFRLDIAKQLYSIFFLPFDSSIESRKRLIGIPDQSLQEISLSILAKYQFGADPLLGAGIRDHVFLGLSHEISLIPSPHLLVRQQQNPSSTFKSRTFVGVGNPILKGSPSDNLTDQQNIIDRETGLGRPMAINTMFEPLEETEVEINRMASLFHPGKRRLLLQKYATEKEFKSIDFREVGVIAFATHAVVSGDFDYLFEPALIMTPPDTATQQDDGFLTASEISKLDIPGSLVILGACNTAAASGRAGAPGLSGLAAAFFRAGARSVVASHWVILSQSSFLLMPSLLENSTATSEGNISLAHRDAMRQVANSKVLPGLSHPGVWGAFSVIGIM